jgi:rubrerythrin
MKPEYVLKIKEQLKSETAAYCGYKALFDLVDDDYLKDALEEIMYDEFLHAKFIRSYLIENDLYNAQQHEELEKSYQKMLEDFN